MAIDTKVGRRELLASAAIACCVRPSRGAQAPGGGTIPGAIRWDAWYGGGSGSEATVNRKVSESLGPKEWQYRAPWFASPISPTLNSINGNTQAIMDAEINYAAGVGLKYWAYCWYGQQNPASPMQNAWNLHQSSSIKNMMNWCLLLQFSRITSETLSADVDAYLSYFHQPNYQAVLDGRPLVYVFIDRPSSLSTHWGNSWSNVHSAFDRLRSSAIAAGLAMPYIVILYGTPAVAASYAKQTGSDGISNYTAGSPKRGEPWPTFEATIESYWKAQQQTGLPIVPIAMVGLDSRPRTAHPENFGKGNGDYVVAPTPTQLTAHLQATVNYVRANPVTCASRLILIYSWDECDEFGCIIPSYNSVNPGKPITSALGALSAVSW